MAAMSGLPWRTADMGTSSKRTGRPRAADSAWLIWAGVGASLASSMRWPANAAGSREHQFDEGAQVGPVEPL